MDVYEVCTKRYNLSYPGVQHNSAHRHRLRFRVCLRQGLQVAAAPPPLGLALQKTRVRYYRLLPPPVPRAPARQPAAGSHVAF